VSDYGYNFGSFFAFLQQKAIAGVQSLTTATLTDFQRWFYYQPTKRGQVRGVVNQNFVLATVKNICRFLKTEGYIHADPAAAVEYAREPRSLPRNVLTPKEVNLRHGRISWAIARSTRPSVICA